MRFVLKPSSDLLLKTRAAASRIVSTVTAARACRGFFLGSSGCLGKLEERRENAS
jgi:hypothetical protein